MRRAILALVAGGIVGAATVFLVTPATRDGQPAAEPAIAVSARLAAYRAAAEVDDIAALEARLTGAAAEPASAERGLAIDANLTRLASLDPARAVGLALTLELGEHFVVSAMQSWAQSDFDAALFALLGIDDAALRRAAALALVDITGNDAPGFERVAVILPEADRTPLVVDWLVWRAASDPDSALREALGLGDADASRRATLRITEQWARQDPRAALAALESLPASRSAEYRERLSEAWARSDAAGYLSYLESVAEPPEFSRAVLWLAAADPARSLRLAERMPGDFGELLYAIARESIAARDPATALADAESLPPGEERDQLLLQGIAALAADDPDAALQQLESQAGVSDGVRLNVYSMILRTRPERAAELIERLPPGTDVRNLARYAIPSSTENADAMLTAADSLLGSDDARAGIVLADLAWSWTQQNPESALRWIETNSESLDALLLGNAARGLASRDPMRAAEFADRLLPATRAEWMLAAAEPYARSDPRGALSWIARYQGQPGYELAMTQVVTRAAQSDPQTAAALVAQASAATQQAAAPAVASSWAGRNPAAAAQWAQGLADPRARAAALTSAVSSWHSRDADAAAEWTLSMARGELRDEALSLLLSRSAAAGSIDRRLIDGISADISRQRTLTGLMLGVARRDADEARALLDDYISDAGLRQQAERYIEAAAGR